MVSIEYIRLMRLHKPIGTLLLLWPTLWGLWLASLGKPSLLILCIFVSGVILMHAAGCVINDVTDRNLDGYIRRTKDRPIIKGTISSVQAVFIFMMLSVIAFALTFMLNKLTVFLTIIAFGIIVIYPYLKRLTYLPQVGLGIAFAWSIPMAFAAERNTIPISAWVLVGACVVWTVAHDTIYAIADREDDIKIGIKSTAILFSSSMSLILALLQFIFILLLILVGVLFQLNQAYYLSVLCALSLFSYQQYLLNTNSMKNISLAYLNNNWVGFVIFLGIYFGMHV